MLISIVSSISRLDRLTEANQAMIHRDLGHDSITYAECLEYTMKIIGILHKCVDVRYSLRKEINKWKNWAYR